MLGMKEDVIKPITVSQLNNYIDILMRGNSTLSNLKITGEITGYKNHSSGHKYFSIKDESAKVNCFLSKNRSTYLRFEPDDGMNVEITGFVSVYKPNGTYSIFVNSMKPSGDGAMAMAFEALKQKLEAEGLFSSEYKKEIPRFASHIGVITSGDGAAIEDIISTISNKNDRVKISIFPSLVQGPEAAKDVSEKIRKANRIYPDMDVLIVGRGGGSREDLWAYNEEALARAVFNSKIPIISGVGHETDFTICDMVADYRAETPTAAAEKAAYNSFELIEYLNDRATLLKDSLSGRSKIVERQIELSISELRREIENLLIRLNHQCQNAALTLEANNPESILKRGYSLATDCGQNIIESVNDVEVGEKITVTLHDGKLFCLVEDKE